MNVVRDVFVLSKFGSYLAKRTDFFNHQKISQPFAFKQRNVQKILLGHQEEHSLLKHGLLFKIVQPKSIIKTRYMVEIVDFIQQVSISHLSGKVSFQRLRSEVKRNLEQTLEMQRRNEQSEFAFKKKRKKEKKEFAVLYTLYICIAMSSVIHMTFERFFGHPDAQKGKD